MIPYTTFRKLRKAGACKERYAHLRKELKGVKDDDHISLVSILETNGLSDALWVPEDIVSGDDVAKRYRLFAVACCQDTLHLMGDQRSIDAVRISHLYAHGEATTAELAAAWDAARAAAWDAAGAAAGAAAWDAARAAAWAAAGAAAWDAARAAAGAAAWDAARAAAWAAAWDAAWAAAGERQAQHFKVIFSAEYC